MAKFIDIESPYSASTLEEMATHLRYARACVRDSLLREEVPFASHLLYTQLGILDDSVPAERERGIKVGKSITEKLGATTVVYTDLGISRGMKTGIEMARTCGREVEYRTLGDDWESQLSALEDGHAQKNVWGYDRSREVS